MSSNLILSLQVNVMLYLNQRFIIFDLRDLLAQKRWSRVRYHERHTDFN